MSYVDLEKRRATRRRYYHEKDASKQIARKTKRLKSLREKYTEYKKTKACINCGENDPHCLEFHHIDPTTKDRVEPANLCRRKGWSFERMKTYLETTCVCVCSNCHRKIHRRIKELYALQNSRVNPVP